MPRIPAARVRRMRADALRRPPAALRGADPDEKKPFTGKGSVWLEEAKSAKVASKKTRKKYKTQLNQSLTSPPPLDRPSKLQ
jgi:hypothetical protein